MLDAFSTGAMLMLFIDDDRLSYLELAPAEVEGRFAEFPASDSITM